MLLNVDDQFVDTDKQDVLHVLEFKALCFLFFDDQFVDTD